MSPAELDASRPGRSHVGLVSPAVSAPLVKRPRLVQKLEEAAAPVVLLNAPSGYGKSVLLAEWDRSDARPFVSITLTDAHNDPVLLMQSIVGALEDVEPVPADVLAALSGPEPSIDEVVVPRLCRGLAARKIPLVLVLDDLEHIESPISLRALSVIGRHLSRGSHLALAIRTEPPRPISRLRADGGLVELGRADLAMSKAESQALLAEVGLDPAPEQLNVLVRHTEGWPAALYLAGLALGDAPDLDRAIAEFAGDDRIVVDYMREEFLDTVSQRRLEFVRRVSILDRFSGDLCDAVLNCSGSATLLRDLSRSNMLLIPLDRRDEWFRFHGLFKEMLGAELHRLEPDEVPELNRRASDWWAEQQDWDRAIDHAIAAGATARAGELLFLSIPEYMTRGRNTTIIRWLDRLGADAVASDPALALTASWTCITRGAGPEAEHWASVCRSLLAATEPSDMKTALEAGLALADAALARRGVEAMSAGTVGAAELLPDDSPWLSMCCLLDGAGLHLRGLREEARSRLREGARRGAVEAPNVQVLCLAQLTLLAIDDDDWQLAETLTWQARAQIDSSGLAGYANIALSLGVSAFVYAHAGKTEKAAADLRVGTHLLAKLNEFAPWVEAETRIALARAAARLDDAPTAAELLNDAARLFEQTPDATVLGDWIRETAAAIEAVSDSAVEDLTTAELRVLQFLPTHLSFPQIAAEIQISRHTVKSQTRNVYRKLGVGSRQEAVARARGAGLLDRDGNSQQLPSGS